MVNDRHFDRRTKYLSVNRLTYRRVERIMQGVVKDSLLLSC